MKEDGVKETTASNKLPSQSQSQDIEITVLRKTTARQAHQLRIDVAAPGHSEPKEWCWFLLLSFMRKHKHVETFFFMKAVLCLRILHAAALELEKVSV